MTVQEADAIAVVDLRKALPLAGDLGPEGLTFIPAHDSSTRRPMLAVAHEVSGTKNLVEVQVTGGRGGRD